MAIILDRDTRVMVQGITGHQGTQHTRAMKEFGTAVVAGVTPGKGGTSVEGVPVFNSIAEAMRGLPAGARPNTWICFVPAPFAKDASYEAMESGIRKLVIITEHIPVQDAMQLMAYADYKKAVVVGPNTPGVISPGERAKVGIMPAAVFRPGRIGVISRSGTLTYEVVNSMSEAGFGQSTCIGLGGDPVVGTSFIEALDMFNADPGTDAMVMVGEIGGSAEENAAEHIVSAGIRKPVFAYIAGRTAPPGRRMGHAGAIVLRGRGTAESKVKALTAAGVKVARVPSEISGLLKGAGL
ncbi:MAG: succinate--CoA ligase subunit alpha [Euryarchaeota archaeon]|nr:succinate--CoA ligase subunit alpha [Euryarchaeota archaeon]